jgi:hypothetical protein
VLVLFEQLLFVETGGCRKRNFDGEDNEGYDGEGRF